MSYHEDTMDRHLSLSEDRAALPVLDMHLHLVDFLQSSSGAIELIEAMDHANISKAVVFGMPVKKKWEQYEPNSPHYYLDDNGRCYYFSLTDEIVAEQYLTLNEEQKKRIAPTICGFNPTDCSSIDHLEYMYNKYPFWKGVGEVLLRHDDLTNLVNEETARANHKALHSICEFCIDKDLPLILHHNSTSLNYHDHSEYLHVLTALLDLFPNLRLVWTHCGISRRVWSKNYTGMLRKILSKYDNLCVDISWVVYDDVICRADANKIIPKQNWLKLIADFADRFMIGSDLCGHFNSLGKTIGRYNSLLNALNEINPDISNKVAFQNANSLWFEGS